MTIKMIARNIGKTADLRVEGFVIQVVVEDGKLAYGSVRYQVRPVAGSGLEWVSVERLRFYED